MTWESGGNIARRPVAVAPMKCRATVQPDPDIYPHQCYRNAVVDGYCRAHEPEAALERVIDSLRRSVRRYNYSIIQGVV